MGKEKLSNLKIIDTPEKEIHMSRIQTKIRDN